MLSGSTTTTAVFVMAPHHLLARGDEPRNPWSIKSVHELDVAVPLRRNPAAAAGGAFQFQCPIYERVFATVVVTLRGSDGSGVRVNDLAKWDGMMGSGHDYYERGNLDIFSGRGPCMSKPPCSMNLISDGVGAHHDWYCNYLEVKATDPHMGCKQQLFTVEPWLATDAAPYLLALPVSQPPAATSQPPSAS